MRKHDQVSRISSYDEKRTGKKAGVSVTTIRNWEQGIGHPPCDILLNICHVLHTDPNTLAGYSLAANNTNGLTEDDQVVVNLFIQHMRNKNMIIKDLSSEHK